MNICNGVSLKSIELKEFRRRNEIYYDNIAMLDIEVSTGFIENGLVVQYDKYNPERFKNLTPVSLMYLWNVCIDGFLFSGRCLDDLFSFLDCLNDMLNGTFYMYIHNAAYEFQFLRNILDGMTVFARKKRHPIKFNWKNIEFRCSYMLTRLSLDTWAKEKNLGVKKLVGMYDYNKLRTPTTNLTLLERDYGYNDVIVGVLGLQEYIDKYVHVKDIPLTQTSCIRKSAHKVMKSEFKARVKVAEATKVSYETYKFMIDVFAGGYTHANIIYANEVIENVGDADFASSYPWCLVSEKYPITPWVKTDKYIRYMSNKDKYCWMAKIRFFKIESKYFNTYISLSKCDYTRGVVLDNGRVMEAEEIVIKILDVDMDIIEKAYDYKSYVIEEFYFSIKGYLPNEYRKYLIELFANKTSLKNNPEKYNLYYKSKEENNGNYGMAVTRDITDEITFNEEWGKDELTVEKYYEKRDKKASKLSTLVMSYAQGIYVPAYGRRNLWHFVHLFDDIILYMDTDSIKYLLQFRDIVEREIENYNNDVIEKQKEIAADLGINESAFAPLDYKGISHRMGLFERDKDIVKFKTMGAKRYICQYDESLGEDYLKMTVSGVRKAAVKQLASIEDFNEKTVFNVDDANKLMLVYLDEQPLITWQAGEYDEWCCTDKYGIAGYNIEYDMSFKGKTAFEYLAMIKKMEDEKTKIFRKGYNNGKEKK